MAHQHWDRVAHLVEDRRLRLDLNQADIARQAGVSDTTWGHLANGRPVSARTLSRAERALGLPSGTLAAVRDGDKIDVDALPDPTQLRLSASGRPLDELAEHDPAAYAELEQIASRILRGR